MDVRIEELIHRLHMECRCKNAVRMLQANKMAAGKNYLQEVSVTCVVGGGGGGEGVLQCSKRTLHC